MAKKVKLSRQRRWQDKMKKEGRCQRCGKPKAEYSVSSCKDCLNRYRK